MAVFAAFDDAMQAFMTQANVRGGTLALIKEGRLVYERGYTYDASQTLPIEPTSLFRIASCTKPLTSLAIVLSVVSMPRRRFTTPYGRRARS